MHELRLLSELDDHGDVSSSSLASLAESSSGLASREVERLVRRGLVSRRQAPADRRYCVVPRCRPGVAMLQALEADLEMILRKGSGG